MKRISVSLLIICVCCTGIKNNTSIHGQWFTVDPNLEMANFHVEYHLFLNPDNTFEIWAPGEGYPVLTNTLQKYWSGAYSISGNVLNLSFKDKGITISTRYKLEGDVLVCEDLVLNRIHSPVVFKRVSK